MKVNASTIQLNGTRTMNSLNRKNDEDDDRILWLFVKTSVMIPAAAVVTTLSIFWRSQISLWIIPNYAKIETHSIVDLGDSHGLFRSEI